MFGLGIVACKVPVPVLAETSACVARHCLRVPFVVVHQDVGVAVAVGVCA